MSVCLGLANSVSGSPIQELMKHVELYSLFITGFLKKQNNDIKKKVLLGFVIRSEFG